MTGDSQHDYLYSFDGQEFKKYSYEYRISIHVSEIKTNP